MISSQGEFIDESVRVRLNLTRSLVKIGLASTDDLLSTYTIYFEKQGDMYKACFKQNSKIMADE